MALMWGAGILMSSETRPCAIIGNGDFMKLPEPLQGMWKRMCSGWGRKPRLSAEELDALLDRIQVAREEAIAASQQDGLEAAYGFLDSPDMNALAEADAEAFDYNASGEIC